jgi:hypothetical protein
MTLLTSSHNEEIAKFAVSDAGEPLEVLLTSWGESGEWPVEDSNLEPVS